MLAANNETVAGETVAGQEPAPASRRVVKQSRLAKMLRLEWIGQTVASLCWIVSVFTYGISQTGDWLQLCAASAWLLANVATVVSPEED